MNELRDESTDKFKKPTRPLSELLAEHTAENKAKIVAQSTDRTHDAELCVRDEYPPPLPELVPAHYWSLDVTLAGIIAKSVRHFRDLDHGYPSDSTHEEWVATLTKIVDGFQAYYDADAGWDRDVNLDEAFELFREAFGELWT